MKKVLSNPFSVLSISLAAGLIFAALVMVRYEGEMRAYLLLYYAPIGVVYVAFMLDRLARLGQTRTVQLVIDLAIILLSLARAFIPIPLISGHSLLLSYTLLSARLKVVRVLAAVVFLEVAYLKLFKWDDAITFLGGIFLGSIAALWYRREHLRVGKQR